MKQFQIVLFFLIFINMLSSAPTVCDNYLTESKNFDYIVFQDTIWGVLKDVQTSDYCYNDFSLGAYIEPRSTQLQHFMLGPYFQRENTITTIQFTDMNISVNGMPLFLNSYSDSGGDKCNLNIWNGLPGGVKVFPFTSTTTFNTTYYITDGTNILATNGTFILDYFQSTSGSGSCAGMFNALKTMLNSTNITSTGINVSGQYTSGSVYYGTQSASLLKWKNYTVGVAISESINGNKGIYYQSEGIDDSTNYIHAQYLLRNYTGSTYFANIMANGVLVEPKWSFILNLFPYAPFHGVYYYPASPYDYTIPLFSGKANVLVDKYNQCYFVPTYNPPYLNITYTITAYPMACDAEISEGTYLNYVPMRAYCAMTNFTSDIISIDFTYLNNVEFEEISYDNGTINSTISLGKELQKEVELKDKYELYANGELKCSFTDGEQNILGLPSFSYGVGDSDFSEILQKLIFLPIFIVITALSFTNPFIFVFNFALNDWFNVFTEATHLFLITITVGIFSLAFNWQGERTMKTLLIYILLGAGYLIYLSSFATEYNSDFASDELTNLGEALGDLQNLFSGVGSDSDIISIITITIPTFLINLIVIMLKLPAIFVGLIVASVSQLLPGSITFLSIFTGPLIIGAYAFILLKIYEIGRNMFRPL